MNIFIARQPIYDRNRQIFGYELLFRQNNENAFTKIDDDTATAEVIYDSFLIFGIDSITDDTRAFINCSKALLESDIINILPKDKVVLEILERGETTPATLEACKRLKSLGYMLALDDFIPTAETQPLLELADIVKIEFSSLNLTAQGIMLRHYKDKLRFLAEKIETVEDYEKALRIGYDYFQGYYFSKPAMLNSKDIGSLNVNLIRILEELGRPEPSYAVIAEIMTSDLGLSYKLLKLVNSAYIAPRYQIKSILQALSFLGMRELYQWMSLMLLKDIQDGENEALIRQSLVRAKLMAALGQKKDHKALNSDYFFTGIFSLIDVVLNRNIEDILADLPLSDKVKHALRGGRNELRLLLDYIISFENAEWNDMNSQEALGLESTDQFMTFYVDALAWAKHMSKI
jgi:EAL and modified HD-GYP domain-containing signal transduction protein